MKCASCVITCSDRGILAIQPDDLRRGRTRLWGAGTLDRRRCARRTGKDDVRKNEVSRVAIGRLAETDVARTERIPRIELQFDLANDTSRGGCRVRDHGASGISADVRNEHDLRGYGSVGDRNDPDARGGHELEAGNSGRVGGSGSADAPGQSDTRNL